MIKATSKSYFDARQYNLILLKISSVCWIVMLVFGNYATSAQNTLAVDRNVVTQPLTIIGTNNGRTKLTEIARTENTATGYCDGYANVQPNHLLDLQSAFKFLRLEVQSPVDTTLMVQGNDGIWCNDDSDSANPMIEGQWQQGLYRVWVGSYQPNTSNSYQIQITGR